MSNNSDQNDGDSLAGQTISAYDIEELQSSVVPWELDMRQMSRGTMTANIHVGQVGDILVTREFWNQRVIAEGLSPPGYLAMSGSGPRASEHLSWCGHEVNSRHLICGLDASEVGFVTPKQEDHWVILIPQNALIDYMGSESIGALKNIRILNCSPRHSRRLFGLAKLAVSHTPGAHLKGNYSLRMKVLRADLLAIAAQLIAGNRETSRPPDPGRYYDLCCRALFLSKKESEPVLVSNLSSALGVGRRTLERAFRETLGISPSRFLRFHRYNQVHKELLRHRNRPRAVTAALQKWGFTELGRSALEYKRLFGESPSETVTAGMKPVGVTLKDALS